MSRAKKLANHNNKIIHFFDQSYHTPQYEGEGEDKRLIAESSVGVRSGEVFKGRCVQGDGVTKIDFNGIVNGKLTVMLDWRKFSDGTIDPLSRTFPEFYAAITDQQFFLEGSILLDSEVDQVNKQLIIPDGEKYYGIHVFNNAERVAYFTCEEGHGKEMFSSIGKIQASRVLYIHADFWQEDADVPFSYLNHVGYTSANQFNMVPDLNPSVGSEPDASNRLQYNVFTDENGIPYSYYGGFETTGIVNDFIDTPNGYGQGWVDVGGEMRLVSYKTYGSDVIMIVGSQEFAIGPVFLASKLEFELEVKEGILQYLGARDSTDYRLFFNKLEEEYDISSATVAFSSVKEFFNALNGGPNTVVASTSETDFPNGSGFDYSTLTNLPGVTQERLIEIFESVFNDNITATTGGVKAFLYSIWLAGNHESEAVHWYSMLQKVVTFSVNLISDKQHYTCDFNELKAVSSLLYGGTYFFSNYNRDIRRISSLHFRANASGTSWKEWTKVKISTSTKIPADFVSCGLNSRRSTNGYTNLMNSNHKLLSGVIGTNSGSRVKAFPSNLELFDDDANNVSTANSYILNDTVNQGIRVVHNKGSIVYGDANYSGAYTQFNLSELKEELVNYEIDLIVKVDSGSPVISITDESSYEGNSATLILNFPSIADGSMRKIRLNKNGLFVSPADIVNGALTLVQETTLLSNAGGAATGSRLKEISFIRVPYRSNNNEAFDCTIYSISIRRVQDDLGVKIADGLGDELEHQGQVREKVAIVENNCLVGNSVWAIQLDEQPTKIINNGNDITGDCLISGSGSDWQIIFSVDTKVFNLLINDKFFIPCSEGQGTQLSGLKNGSEEVSISVVNSSGGHWGTQDQYAYNAFEGGWLNEVAMDESQAFTTKWNTSVPVDSDASVSNANQLKLPVTSITDEIYVDWGDGTSEFIQSNETQKLTHTYFAEGEYDVKVWGDYEFAFANTGDREKLLSIDQWGSFKLGRDAFYGCTQLTVSAIDRPQLKETLISTFRDCASITEVPNINSWDTSAVTNLNSVFRSALVFNQDLNNWNTNRVTDFGYSFFGAAEFNGSIESWNTSLATTLKGMFYRASKFNQPLTNWNVENVTDFSEMFREAFEFNQDLSHFNMSKANNVSQMFFSATSFNNKAARGESGNPLNWVLSNVTNASYLFRSAQAFNQDISTFDLGQCQTLFQAFAYMNDFDQNLNGLDTSNVINFTDTFRNSNAFNNGNQPLRWNTPNATNMTGMFMECPVFDQDISTFSVRKVSKYVNMFAGAKKFNNGGATFGFNDFGVDDLVTSIDMNSMFNGAEAFDQSLNHWNTEKVTSMRHLFKDAKSFNQELHNWKVDNVTDMYGTFNGTILFNNSLNTWVVNNVVDFGETFHGASSFNGNIVGWETDSAESMLSMFKNATNFNQAIGSWNVARVKNMKEMFYGASSFNQSLTNWNVSSVTDMSYMFNAAIVFNGDITGWNDKLMALVNASCMFCSANAFNQPIGNWNVSNVQHFTEMFYNAKAFNQPIPTWNLTGSTSTKGMFKMAINFNQDISGWNTSIIEDMDYMFQNASSFNNGNVAGVGNAFGLDVSSVKTFRYMFNGATAFNQDLTSWDVSSGTSFQGMFELATVFNNGDVAGASTKPLKWDTTSMTDCSEMFQKASVFNQKLEDKLTTNNWNTSNVTIMHYMFDDAKKFNQDISGFDVSNVETMHYMFKSAEDFNQDISSWNLSSVVNTSNMFRGALDFNNGDAFGVGSSPLGWNVSSIQYMNDMFFGAAAFNQDISDWDIGNVIEFGNDFMTDAVPFSKANYDLLLQDWAGLSNIPMGVTVNFGNTNFTLSDTAVTNARSYLMNDKNWTILDGGGI